LQQLTGVWVIAFGFALLGLVLKCYFSPRRQRKEEDRPRRLLRPDQWLNRPSYDVIIDGFCYDAANNHIFKHRLYHSENSAGDRSPADSDRPVQLENLEENS
jgi:hypothetical protein